MNMASLLVFGLFFLSFFQLSADGAGSFIALDVASVLYFLVHPKGLLRNSPILMWLAAAFLAFVATWFLIGANEFAFLARVVLIFLDAFFLQSIFRPKLELFPEKECSHAVWLAAMAYAIAFGLWLWTPSDGDTLFYLNSPKAWIATFPALFAVSELVAKRSKVAVLWALAGIGLSLFDSSTSRALLLQSALILILALWQSNRRLAKFTILAALTGSLFSLAALDSFVEKHDHSNTFRLVMILQIFDFSSIEAVFGRGIDSWRQVAFQELFEMPGAEAFFESANPHFFPAEVVIRGGLAVFTCIFGAFYTAFRQSRLFAVPMVMLLATFFTTNTGVERLYMTLGIFVLLSVPGWRSVKRMQMPESTDSLPGRELDEAAAQGQRVS